MSPVLHDSHSQPSRRLPHHFTDRLRPQLCLDHHRFLHGAHAKSHWSRSSARWKAACHIPEAIVSPRFTFDAHQSSAQCRPALRLTALLHRASVVHPARSSYHTSNHVWLGRKNRPPSDECYQGDPRPIG